MTVVSLDQICKNLLLKRRYSLHYYLDFLLSSKDALREISFDLPIQTARYKCLPVNPNGNTADLPDDYSDYSRVSIRVDQWIHPLVENDQMQLVPNYDSDFNIQPYSGGVATQSPTLAQFGYSLSGYYSPYWYMVNWNTWGENTGRNFGGVGAYCDTFRIDKSRNQIKLNENLYVGEVLLEYIGNGLDADSATHIDVYAQNTIEAYAMWQFYLHNRTYSQNEANDMEQKYIKERLILAARLSDLTLDRLKRIVQGNSNGIKY